MRIWVDIDETICFYEGVKRLYINAIPKYNNIDKKTQAYLTSILFLSPTVRSLCAWPYPLLWSVCFFLISIFYFLKFQKSNSSKQKIKYSIFNIIFLALSSYITPNFSVFAIYFLFFFSVKFL